MRCGRERRASCRFLQRKDSLVEGIRGPKPARDFRGTVVWSHTGVKMVLGEECRVFRPLSKNSEVPGAVGIGGTCGGRAARGRRPRDDAPSPRCSKRTLWV